MSNNTTTETRNSESQHFIITLQGQAMHVTFEPHYFADYGHVEFTSPYAPRRRILVSGTGYRSHFAPMHKIESYPDIETYAKELAIALMSIKPCEENEDQLNLFD